jgi:hypothetical protein
MMGSAQYASPGSSGGTMPEVGFGGTGYDYLRRAPSIPTDGVVIYDVKKLELERAYSQLTFAETIRVRGIFRIILVLVSLIWMLYLALSKINSLVLPAAHAAQPVTSPRTFIPPLGLTQGIFNIIVLMFAVVMVFVVGAAAYSAFLARSKNAKAASFVEHLGTFLVGTLFGTVVPRQ